MLSGMSVHAVFKSGNKCNSTRKTKPSTKECGLSASVKVGASDPIIFHRNAKVTTPVATSAACRSSKDLLERLWKHINTQTSEDNKTQIWKICYHIYNNNPAPFLPTIMQSATFTFIAAGGFSKRATGCSVLNMMMSKALHKPCNIKYIQHAEFLTYRTKPSI